MQIHQKLGESAESFSSQLFICTTPEQSVADVNWRDKQGPSDHPVWTVPPVNVVSVSCVCAQVCLCVCVFVCLQGKVVASKDASATITHGMLLRVLGGFGSTKRGEHLAYTESICSLPFLQKCTVSWGALGGTVHLWTASDIALRGMSCAVTKFGTSRRTPFISPKAFWIQLENTCKSLCAKCWHFGARRGETSHSRQSKTQPQTADNVHWRTKGVSFCPKSFPGLVSRVQQTVGCTANRLEAVSAMSHCKVPCRPRAEYIVSDSVLRFKYVTETKAVLESKGHIRA